MMKTNVRKKFKSIMLLFMWLMSLSLVAQNITVKGTITDATLKEPIIGVTIIVEGKASQGTVTDIDGNFTLSDVPTDATLIVSYVGYVSQNIPVRGRKTINIILTEDTELLDEVVVIGYGVQKKSSVTAAVTTVKVDEIQKTQYSDATEALQGRVPGVSVSIGTEPGSGPKVQIRGTGSLTNQTPLYVIDGVFTTSMESLSSNDIATMQVLKDASAAAIYGSRAANGVVIITTKSGSSGEMRIEFESSVGMQTPTKKLSLMNSTEWASLNNAYADILGFPRAPKNDKDFDPSKSYDYQDYFISNAPVYSADLSLSGGNDIANLRASFGFLSQDGLQIGSGAKRYTARVNSSFKKGRYEAIQTLGYTRREQQKSLKGRDFYTKPTISPYADTPSGYGVIPGDYNIDNSTQENAVIFFDLTDNYLYSDIISGSLNNSFELFDNFKYHLNGSLMITNGHDYFYKPKWVTLLDEKGNPAKDESFNPTKSELNESWNRKTQFTIDNLLTYSKTFKSHNLDVMLGISWNEESFRLSRIEKVGGFLDNSITVPIGEGTISGNDFKTALLSYFGRLNYDYDNKYLLSFAIRRDESSLFHKDNRVGVFPSVSAGWNIHNEPFFNIPSINQLKLRASYGQIGANFLDPYSYQTRIAANVPAIFGDDYRELGTIEILANQSLKWETSTTFDIGFDVAFLENKYYMEFDYYNKTNSSLLARLEASPSSGQGVYYGQAQGAYYNSAQISNKGFEFLIGARPSVDNIKFDMSLSVAHVKNNVDKLGDNVQPIFGGTISGHFDDRGTITNVGLPVSSFWGYTVDGIYKVDPTANDPEPGKKAGDFIYKDISGPDGVPDGVITEADKGVIGNPWPDFELGFNLGVSYKNWDMTMLFQGNFGNDIFYFLKRYSYFNYEDNLVKDAGNYWTPNNPTGTVPRLMAGQMGSMNVRPSSWYVEDGSYLRCKIFQIAYNLPNSLLEKLSVSNLKLYANVDNLFTISKFSGIDPEVTSVMGSGFNITGMQDSDENFLFNRGMILNEYPRAKTFKFGVKVVF